MSIPYHQRPDVKERKRQWRREYNQRPAVKKHRREYAAKVGVTERRKAWLAANPNFHLLRGARTRAKEYGVPCTITMSDFTIPSHCPALGIPLVAHRGEGRGPAPDSPTLDRIIPSLGYVPGNVRVISHKANAIKSNGTGREILAVALWTISVTEQPPALPS